MRQKGGIPFEWDITATQGTTEHNTSLTTKLVRKPCRIPSKESCFCCLSTEFPLSFTMNGLICIPWLRECSPVVVTDLGQDEFSGLSIVLLLVFLTMQTIERERLEVATLIDRTNVLSIGQTTTVIPSEDSYQQILQKTCESVSDHWFRQWMERGRGGAVLQDSTSKSLTDKLIKHMQSKHAMKNLAEGNIFDDSDTTTGDLEYGRNTEELQMGYSLTFQRLCIPEHRRTHLWFPLEVWSEIEELFAPFWDYDRITVDERGIGTGESSCSIFTRKHEPIRKVWENAHSRWEK